METMSSSCPACGGAIEFSERTVVWRSGTCPACQKEFAFLEGVMLPEQVGPEMEGRPATPVGAPAEVAENAPECEECGSPLTFRAGSKGAVLAECAECETSTVYRPESEEEPPETERRRLPRAEYGEGGGPRGRPCRKCGAPLRFSTGEDGMLVGECEACGNRFTLPPRPGGARREYGFRDRARYGRRDFGPPRGGRPRYSDRGPGGARPFRRTERQGRPPPEDDERRRRRRRREE